MRSLPATAVLALADIDKAELRSPPLAQLPTSWHTSPLAERKMTGAQGVCNIVTEQASRRNLTEEKFRST